MKNVKQKLSDINPRQWLPYLVAVLVFVIMTVIYVSPVLEGKRLMQSDIIKWRGMAKEIADFREATGEEALWTNSMFGGMPAYQISVIYGNNIANFMHQVMTLWLPRPADMVFLYFIGFFLFMLMLRINVWVAMAGAVAFAFSSYHFIIIEAGHNSKAIAIAYMAPVLGAIVQTFRGKYLGGGLLFAIFMALQLFANHYQITYYLGIIVVFYGLAELYIHIREKRLTSFVRAMVALMAGLVIAIGLNIGNFWSTYSYTSETMRGGSEITLGEEQTTSGLTKEYITNWSYGIHETFSLLIPNAKGGASGMLGNNPRAMEAVSPNFESIIARENHYWGNQPFTSGSVYVGAVVLFFFFLGLFYLKGPLKYGMLAAIILSIMLSWGKNFMPLTDFFIDYIPGYNKFRAVSMTLVIAELCIPALAFIGLHKLYKDPSILSYKDSSFLAATGLTAGIALLFYITPTTFFSFMSRMEASAITGLLDDPTMSNQVSIYMTELEKARVAIFRADAIRSFLFAIGAAGLVWLYAAGKLKKTAFIIILIGLLTLDMWPVNRRYLNDEDFITRRRAEVAFPLTQADVMILQDNDPNFRVLDLTDNPFTSSRASYYHHSIGGYHGAKLQRYQDLIDSYLVQNVLDITTNIRHSGDPDTLDKLIADMHVLNMLNTRYVIYNHESPPFFNGSAMSNAWFVNDIVWVENADQEILALDDADIRHSAIVDRRFASHLEGRSFNPDPMARVELVHAQPNHLSYQVRTATEQVLIFSEIFYPDGWNVEINGEPVDHFRANYILRAMVVPAGTHEIDFRFEPVSYYTSEKISLAFSIILVLLVLSYLGMWLTGRTEGVRE